MKRTILAEARWEEKYHHWKINASVEGQRRSFYSSDPSRHGKKEAEAKAQAWADLRSGSDMPFQRAVENWLDFKKAHVSVSTFKSQSSFIRKHFLRPDLTSRRISRITLVHWQSILDAASADGLSYNTVRLLRRFILEFASYAQKSRWPISNFAPKDLELPVCTKRKEKAILQPHELKTLFSVDTALMYNKRCACWHINAFRLAAILGLRRGEITALRWQNVSENTLYVASAVNQLEIETPGKTANAQRLIVLNAHVRQILAAQRDLLKKHRIVSPWVFPNKLGHRERACQFSDDWQRYTKSNNINSAVTFHCLRHTMISLFKADVPEQLLKQVVGHSGSMDTFGQYGHSLDDDASRASALMETALSRYI